MLRNPIFDPAILINRQSALHGHSVRSTSTSPSASLKLKRRTRIVMAHQCCCLDNSYTLSLFVGTMDANGIYHDFSFIFIRLSKLYRINIIYVYTSRRTIELVDAFGFKCMQNRIFPLAQNQARENGETHTTATTTTTNSDPQGCLVGYQCLCPTYPTLIINGTT